MKPYILLTPGPLTTSETVKEGRCVVMHDAPSFLFITDINRFIFFKLR